MHTATAISANSTTTRLTQKLYRLALSGLVVVSAMIPALANADAVGYIGGELDVSGGVASYSIPIAVPPGIAGMEPILSFNYNSQSGNGLLGLGWNLGGLSVVHRCGSSIAQDGASEAIKLTSADNYCIDGQRLVPVSGVKGESGTEYRTEQDGFSKIISYGVAGNGPAWFKVWTKSGQVMEYGNTDDSRIEAQGKATVMTWATNEISDTAVNANPINFAYTEIPENSEFVPATISYGPNGTRQVRFTYSAVTDLPGQSLEGSNFKTSKRLDSVATYVNDQPIQSWAFTFNPVVDQPDQLTAIELCDVSGNCMPETTFDWQEYSQVLYSTAEPEFLDFNGDGLADKHAWAGISSGNAKLKVQLNNGNGYNSPIIWATNIKAKASQVLDPHRDFGYITVYSYPELSFGDFNGDGKTDFLSLRPSGVNISGYQTFHDTHISTGSAFTRRGSNQLLNYFAGFGDVNQDGREDLLSSGGKVQLANSSGIFGSLISWGPAFKTVRKQVQSCSEQDSGTVCNTHWANVTPTCSVVDVNGDSLADQLCEDGRVYVAEWSGYKAYTSFSAYSANADKVPLLSSINNNTATQINYAHINSNDIHDNSGLLQGAKDVRGQMFLVNQVTSDNGADGEHLTHYKYNGAKHARNGRGLLGFNWVEETDQTTGSRVRTEFRQDFPFVGMPKSVSSWLAGADKATTSDDILISQSTTQYADRSSTDGKIHFVHVTDSSEENYESDGSLVSTVNTVNSNFDDYGNLGQVTVSTTAGNETYTKTSINNYLNHTELWHLGRLFDSTVTHTHADGSQITRKSAFEYDATTGLLSQEVVEPGSANAVTTGYTYDDYGNKIAVTSSAPGMTNRSAQTEYDVNGQFPVKSINALGHSETRLVDPAYGTVTSRTGPNGLTTAYQFDGFGNAIGETRTDGNTSSVTTLWAASCPETVTGASYCVITQTDGSAPVHKYFDKLNRSIRTVSVGFDGRKVLTDQVYNALGQVTQVSRPYYEGGTPEWGYSFYDEMGRVVRQEEPGPDGTTKISRTEYNGLTTVGINAANEQKTTVTNALGKIISVTEPEGASATYRYDALGNLIETQDDQGNTTQISYDLLGRKVGMDDPDMGIWTYGYNGFGELVNQTDAKGQTVTMKYDVLGRMTKRTGAEGVSYWYYDWASHSIGKLNGITTPGFKKKFRYDAMGRLFRTISVIDGKTIEVKQQYDSYGRPSATIRPQGFITENVYNAQGYLEAVRSPKTAQLDDEMVQLLAGLMQQQADLIAQANSYSSLAHSYKAKALEYIALTQVLNDTEEVQLSTALSTAAMRLRGTATNLRNASAKAIYLANAIRDTLSSFTNTYDAELRAALDLDRSTNAEQFVAQLSTAEWQLQQAEIQLANSNTGNVSEIQLDQYSVEISGLLTQLEQLLAEEKILEEEALVLEQQLSIVQTEQTGNHITFWTAKDHDASGRLLEETYGNSLTSQYTYDNSNGLMTSQRSGFVSVEDIRHLTYQYDQLNNVTQRADLVGEAQEAFSYDGLDRLITSTVTSQLQGASYNKSVNYEYDTLGNITHKSDVGLYQYGSGISSGAGPHAVTVAGGKTYQYDANGNMTSGGGRSIQWSSYNKPVQVTKGTNTVAFRYGPDRSRYLKTESNGNQTLYIGKLYEQITNSNQPQMITHKQFIYAGGQLVATHSSGLDSLGAVKAPQTRYLHKDNLGSIDTITDALGNVVDRMSFDPFGQRRQNDWRAATAGVSVIPVLTNRGFTGHEHLDDVGLIHMNGRVYDGELGRFLSADPNVQAPYATQNLNRYSYAMNNPLKYTDPSGFFFKKLFKSIKKAISNAAKFVKKYWRVIVAAVVTYYTFGAVQGWALGLGTSCTAGSIVTANVIAGAAAGFAGGLIASGGDLKAAMVGGLTGAAGGFIGASSAFGSVGDVTAGRVLAHGAVGGLSSKAQGGKFSSGFISSAFTKSVSGRIQTIAGENAVGGVLATAAVGGTASVMGGGKFANGAVTSSLQYTVNQSATGSWQKIKQMFKSGTYAAGIGADAAFFDKGVSFSLGVMGNTGNGEHPADFGIYISYGRAKGIDFSAHAELGICDCDTYQMYGDATANSLSVGPFGWDIPQPDSTAPYFAQFGKGPIPFSMTKTDTFTYPITYRVVRDGLKSTLGIK